MSFVIFPYYKEDQQRKQMIHNLLSEYTLCLIKIYIFSQCQKLLVVINPYLVGAPGCVEPVFELLPKQIIL